MNKVVHTTHVTEREKKTINSVTPCRPVGYKGLSINDVTMFHWRGQEFTVGYTVIKMILQFHKILPFSLGFSHVLTPMMCLFI